MGNRFLVGILFVVVGVIAGVSLLVSISVAINTTMAPMASKLHEISVSQRKIEEKITAGGGAGNVNDLQARIAVLENKITILERRGAEAPSVAQQMPPIPSEDFNKVYEIPVGESYVYGKKNAAITIVEFTDLQCPFCARFHPAIQEVLKAYPNDVKYMLKNYPLPFHAQARPAAKAALAAGEQGKYFEMVNLLLDNQQTLSEDKFKELASSLKLNVDKFVNDYKNKDAEWEKRIIADITLAGEVDTRGTPTFYLNGRKTNARDFNGWKAEIDKILKK